MHATWTDEEVRSATGETKAELHARCAICGNADTRMDGEPLVSAKHIPEPGHSFSNVLPGKAVA